MKSNKRDSRGVSDKVIVASASSNIPRYFTDFLKNGENRTRLIESIKEEFIKNSKDYLDVLKSDMIIYSLDGTAIKITRNDATEVAELSSNQEEADTKLLLHTNHALLENSNQKIILRSPSGDVDVNILCLAIFPLQTERIWVDYGAGEHRHILRLNSIDMNDEKKLELLGFHAFTGLMTTSLHFFVVEKKSHGRL